MIKLHYNPYDNNAHEYRTKLSLQVSKYTVICYDIEKYISYLAEWEKSKHISVNNKITKIINYIKSNKDWGYYGEITDEDYAIILDLCKKDKNIIGIYF